MNPDFLEDLFVPLVCVCVFGVGGCGRVELPDYIHIVYLISGTQQILFNVLCPKYCRGHTYTKGMFVVHPTFKFNWVSCISV